MKTIALSVIGGSSVLRIDIVQPVDYEHVPIVSRERFRLIPFNRVRAHGYVVRTQQRFAGQSRHAQIFARTRDTGVGGRGIVSVGRRRFTLFVRQVTVTARRRFFEIELALRQPFQCLVGDQQTPLDVISSYLYNNITIRLRRSIFFYTRNRRAFAVGTVDMTTSRSRSLWDIFQKVIVYNRLLFLQHYRTFVLNKTIFITTSFNYFRFKSKMKNIKKTLDEMSTN